MLRTSVNHAAVLVAALAAFALSFVWFTLLFRAPYLAGLGKTSAQLSAGPSTFAASSLQLFGYVTMAYVTAWLLARTGSDSVGEAATLAALAWVGYVASVIGPMHAYQAYSLKFFAICAGCPLFALLGIAVIVALWR